MPQDPNDEPASVLLERIQKDRSTHVKGEKGKIEVDNLNDVSGFNRWLSGN